MSVLDVASQSFTVGLAAFLWIVVVKILAARFGDYIPTPVRDLIAIV